MIGLQQARALSVGAAGFGQAFVVSTPAATATIPILDTVLWTTEINGQMADVTVQGLVTMLSCAVGFGGLLLAIYRTYRGKV